MGSTTKTVLLIATVGILAASTLVGCGLWMFREPPPMMGMAGAAGTTEPVELRTYEVPSAIRNDLSDMLRSALGSGDSRLGRVTDGPGGTVIVVAPPLIQAGIEQLLNADFEASPVASPIKLTYWLLVGRPAESGATPFSVVGRSGLSQLEPVLAEIATAQGPTEFSLLEHIQLTSMSQDLGQASGRVGQVRQTATRAGDQIVADVTISLNNGNMFRSRVMLETGQFLVLGQAGFAGDWVEVFPDARGYDELTLYYVMTADPQP